MNTDENKLSDYIDRLNDEKTPDDATDSKELAELFQTVKAVRSLKDATMPARGFQKKLTRSLEKELSRKNTPKKRWLRFSAVAGIAAIILLSVLLKFPIGDTNIVHAMEKAFQKVEAYHAILEITEMNAKGESATQSKLEVWVDQAGHYYMKELEGAQKGLITVNNGKKKWQIRTAEKEVHVFSAFPDNYRFIFELGNEIDKVKSAVSTEVIGDEVVAGRDATVLQVTPKGGEPYKIWIDKETSLPLQKQSAMYHALQYKTTYTEIEFNNAIPDELIAFHVPDGYKEMNKNPEQVVNNVMEAKEAVGFIPVVPGIIPKDFERDRMVMIPNEKLVKIYYETSSTNEKIAVIEGKAAKDFTIQESAILGKMNNNDVEVQSPIQENVGILSGGSIYSDLTNINSIRWQEEGLEFAVVGNVSIDKLKMITESIGNGKLELPSAEMEMEMNPEVDVDYDLTVEENDQKSVDAGNSPWRLDPAFVAQVFVSLQISPEGIAGDYPIDMKDLKLVEKTEQGAIVEVNSKDSPIKKVYLKRLIRQDSTGIWTVLGYDPVK